MPNDEIKNKIMQGEDPNETGEMSAMDMLLQKMGDIETLLSMQLQKRHAIAEDDTENTVLTHELLARLVKGIESIEQNKNTITDTKTLTLVGEKGADADPIEIAQLLKDSDDFLEKLKADPYDIASLLKEDSAFVQLIKGDRGDDGAPGEKGNDGKDGKTPKKGEDYYTEADKKEFIAILEKSLDEKIPKKVKDAIKNAIKDVPTKGGLVEAVVEQLSKSEKKEKIKANDIEGLSAFVEAKVDAVYEAVSQYVGSKNKHSHGGGTDFLLTNADDIDFTTLANDYALKYNATLKKFYWGPASGGGGGGTWGSITGTLSAQTDLQTALNAKYDASNPSGFITAASLAGYVPYTGATATLDLGTNALTTLGNVTANSFLGLTVVRAGAASQIYWNGRSIMKSPSDGMIYLRNNADSAYSDLTLKDGTAQSFSLTDTVLAGSGSLAGSVLNLAQTWNTTGAPTALKLNVTNTASGASALLMDLQVGGVSQFKVDKAGIGTFAGALNLGGALTTSFNVTGNSWLGSTLVRCGATSGFSWNGRSFMASPADGQITLFNNANTGFTRLNFGGTTSSFATIKLNGTLLQFRLADDSADAPISSAQIFNADNAITAVANAATVTRAFRNNVVTNNSAAGLTITLSTSGAAAGDMILVQILDFSAAAQTLTFVNTENSTVSVPANTNGSTTLPLSVGFKWNAATSKWRCIASA